MTKFTKLWINFPNKAIIEPKCFNKQKTSQKPFGNYCAVLLSECLIRSGIKLNNFKGNKCWSHSGDKHALLASDLADWINKYKPIGFGAKERIAPASFQNALKGRTGVIYFKDYWQRGNQTFEQRSGDHIDLWNENEITSSSMWVRHVLEFFNVYSDLNKSKEVWFWEIK